MLHQDIRQMQDGTREVSLECPADEIPGMFPEFAGSIVRCTGTLRKIGKRFLFNLEARATAHLECDLSLEEFDEEIVTQFEILFIADTELRLLAGISGDEPYITDRDERIIRSDSVEIDLTEDVREELCTSLPLKRVAPQYRGKDISDIFPGIDGIITEKSEPKASPEDNPFRSQLSKLINKE